MWFQGRKFNGRSGIPRRQVPHTGRYLVESEEVICHPWGEHGPNSMKAPLDGEERRAL
jgi:hypothetical protein